MPAKFLVIGNKAYSSWSLRPWMLLTHFQIPFEELVIPLDMPGTQAAILKYSPSGKVPFLQDGDTKLWETLAIAEYIAEVHQEHAIWPAEKSARAHARVLASEMHAGFMALRAECSMNFRRAPRPPASPLSVAARADVDRLEAAFADARARFGKAGPFLFGVFCAADAMFAPVVNRLHAYAVPVGDRTRTYMDAVMALPAWIAWEQGAAKEPWFIGKYERL